MKTTPPIPDRWYALNQLGKVIKEGEDQKKTLSDEAFYYLRREYHSNHSIGYLYKYQIYNTLFETTVLRYNGVIGRGIDLVEKPYHQKDYDRRMEFVVVDRSDVNLGYFYFNGGISAFQFCIKFMEEIGRYGSYKEMVLTKELEQYRTAHQAAIKLYTDEVTKNKELEARLQAIYNSKSDLRKLSALLYEQSK
jgi:hypothetical protein